MKKILMILLIIAVSATIFAQNDQQRFSRYILANSELGYITILGGFGNLKPLWFEAKMVPNYLIRIRGNSRTGAVLTPKVIVRMYREESEPVATPSYLPQITFYNQLKNFNPMKSNIFYLFGRIVHHSNGQDGEFFNPDGSINTENGSFSTNYLELGFFYAKLFSFHPNATEFFRSSIEYHPESMQDKVLNDMYGNIRWHNDIQIFKFTRDAFTSIFSGKSELENKTENLKERPHLRAIVNSTFIFGEMEGADVFDFSKRFSGSILLSYNPKFLEDVRFFMQYYYGQDYYNIHFKNTLSVLRIGMIADPFGF
ncbi:MAG: hypothetical protein K9N09_01060 [Candidatus Cloacimonetes bacterium]|nr:hypothetical protein [Candidatus Cloacimonadota bacterium]MCF7813005.1 hypothetical protein [Candidatus Cloacimonadota bacterium]MCF7867263.1 hypothetical protein [Candidatus Cloacimonadota bacterium]MCF7882707.1 hypothetical protein [Candidatus Cloacimonadota bacterium]